MPTVRGIRGSYGAVYLALLLLAGCAGFEPATEQTVGQAATGVDGVACVGTIDNPPPGMAPVADDALLQEALGASGAGELCVGQVFVAREPVTVYRVWDGAKDYTLYGSWWSFQLPEGPRPKYRQDNGICPSWSELNRMSACQVRVGTKLVVGPGQSAQCKQMTYDKSAVNQVYIPNNARAGVLHVENCTAGAVWP